MKRARSCQKKEKTLKRDMKRKKQNASMGDNEQET